MSDPVIHNLVDAQFVEKYRHCLDHGWFQEDRTGVGTYATHAAVMRFDCQFGQMPIISLRGILPEKFQHEMHWFVSGNTNIKYLRDNKVGIWDSWFIKGTDKYDDVPRDPYTFQERIYKAHELGLMQKLYEFADFEMVSEPDRSGNYQYINVDLCPEITSTWDLFSSEVRQIEKWLTDKNVPTHKHIPKPISLKRRLARVSKNDAAWEQINKAAIPDPMIDWDGENEKVVVFRDNKFVEITLDYGQVINIGRALDKLGVPAYPLLEADIGQGGYGAQWRKWPDTQLVSLADDAKPSYADYVKQGYKQVGTAQLEMTTIGEVVMHRNIDQLQNCIDTLRTNPDDRRIIVTAHNPGRTWQAALPPCHLYFQFTSQVLTMAQRVKLLKYKYRDFVELPQDMEGTVDQYLDKHDIPRRGLNCFVLLRSSDLPLGAVFNVAQYAYLLHMVAHVTKHAPMELVTVGVNAHIYLNQVEAIKELIWRDSDGDFDARMVIKGEFENIDDITFNDVEITGYTHGPFMDIPVAV
jgi:thymidylate synthase